MDPVLLLLGMLGALAGIAALYSVQRDSEDYWMVQVVASLAAFVGVAFVLVSAVILDLVGPGVQWETSLQQLLGLFTFLFLPI